MTARITFSLASSGELEIWLNEEGRDLLVREMQGLSEKKIISISAPMTAAR